MSKALELLEARGLDVETCDRLGIVPDPQHGGDVVRIDFVRDGEIVRRKWRELQHRHDRRWRCWQEAWSSSTIITRCGRWSLC